MSEKVQGKKNLERKKEFLKQGLENARVNLEGKPDAEMRELFEEEIKSLKRWLKELEAGSGKITEDSEFLEWKRYFLENELKCVQMILDEEEDLSEKEREEFEEETNFIKGLIKELKTRD